MRFFGSQFWISYWKGAMMNARKLVCCAVLFSFAALASAATAQAALVNQWNFEEPDGQSAPQVTDIVGGNHGTFVNMTDSNRSNDYPAAMGGRSLGFDGVNERVGLNSQIAFADNQDFSVSLWYKGTDTTQNGDWGGALVGRDNNDIFANLVVRDGKFSYIHYDGTWNHNLESTTMVADDEWHHLVYVNHANETGDIYVDGIPELTGLPSSLQASAFRIDGFMNGFNMNFTQGLLDDVRIYDQSLTASEVFTLFAEVQPTPPPAPEPSACALVGIGMLVMTTVRRQPRRRVS
jgi:hypothetical protein